MVANWSLKLARPVDTSLGRIERRRRTRGTVRLQSTDDTSDPCRGDQRPAEQQRRRAPPRQPVLAIDRPPRRLDVVELELELICRHDVVGARGSLMTRQPSVDEEHADVDDVEGEQRHDDRANPADR